MKTRIKYIGICYICRDLDYNVYTLTNFEFLADSTCDKCGLVDTSLALAMTFVGEASIEELHAASGLETF